MTKKEYVKPNCVEFGNLTEDTKFNLVGNGLDGPYPDRQTAMESDDNPLINGPLGS